MLEACRDLDDQRCSTLTRGIHEGRNIREKTILSLVLVTFDIFQHQCRLGHQVSALKTTRGSFMASNSIDNYGCNDKKANPCPLGIVCTLRLEVCDLDKLASELRCSAYL